MTPELIYWGVGALILVIAVAIFIAKRKKKADPVPSTPTKPEPKPNPEPEVEPPEGPEIDPPTRDPEPPLEVDEGEVRVSTDMTAKQAIDYIRNTAVEKLGNFVTDDEDRVTVQRAWERKQED